MSSRVIPRESLGKASPVRLDSLAGGGGVRAPGTADDGGLRKAIEKAFQEGFRAGQSAAREDAERDRGHLQAILASHERALGQLDDALARAIVELSVDLARHVTRAHLAVREDAVLPVIRDALAQLREDTAPARIHLSPADAELARRDLGEELAERACRVVPDPSLSRGDVRLVSAHAEIDATMPTRWRKAMAPLGETNDWIA